PPLNYTLSLHDALPICEGLGNKFLSHIREVEAIVHVVRCFENADVVHVDGNIDPIRDIETINMELMLSDMELLERRLEKTQKAADRKSTRLNSSHVKIS